MIQTALTFDDILLIPRFSSITSRSEVDLRSNLDPTRQFSLPVISSPMDTVTEVDMCVAMSNHGGLGIIHRYNSIEEQVELVKDAKLGGAAIYVGAAVGSTGDYHERALELFKNGVDVICVDVAHGHHQNVKEALDKLQHLKDTAIGTVHIMAGNVATGKGFQDLSDWGADSIRVGIGGGCFVPGTLVNTENGLKKIEDIKVGDKVFSHTGKLQPVVDTLTFDRDEEIVSINGIDCTKNHEFYILDKENANRVNEDNIHLFARWVHAEELNMEKHLLIELE
jgi:IMP dehydrogenase/GMP reductase